MFQSLSNMFFSPVNSGAAPAPPHTTVLLGPRVEERTFTMKIENFEILCKSAALRKEQKYEFQAGETIGLPVKIAFYLDQTETRNRQYAVEKWIGGYFELVEKPQDVEEVYVSFSEVVKFSNGRKYDNVERLATENLAACHNGWGFKLFKTTSNLTSIIPKDGCVIIEVSFKLFAPKPPGVDVQSKLQQFHAKSCQQLIRDLEDNEALTEVKGDAITKIVSKDKVEFPVNRGVLAARSNVFNRMFHSDMRETATGEVHIDDLSSKTLSVLLRYLRNGTLHEDWRSEGVLEELTYAAAKYELGLLTEFLDDVLGSVCSVRNAQPLAILVNRLDMKKAEKELLQFIQNNSHLLAMLEDDEPPAKKTKSA